jgi:hypothetical protein
MAETVELDKSGLEAAARAIELRLQFVPHGGKSCMGEWVVSSKETENFHRECIRAADEAVRAYLRTAGLVSVPVVKE